MNTRKPLPEARLAEQTEALSLYLDALFADKPASLPVPVAPPAAPVRPVIDLPATALRVVVETPAPVVEVPVAPPVSVTATSATVAATTQATEFPERPDWAQEPFPCLLLKINGLSLALPLVKLNRILDWIEPTPIPGYLPWLLGMVPAATLERNLKVVDTARFVIPERLPPATDAGAGGNPHRHIVMIGDGEWDSPCEDVSEIMTIDPDKVRWRTSRSKRPWLAGTVIDHLCALLDAEQLAEMLSAGTAAPPF
ncbi:MAG: chemotaxis protein CheW [Chromatiales bacterium]|nr:chemotaxis protein CheW [Chromatiales bacterium]